MKQPKNYAAININFDSLGEAFHFPKNYRDPSFHEVAERFFYISEKYNFKYSIYVIGKDLADRENRARVREWAEGGHEIGNHSWSHSLSLGALPKTQIYDEVIKAHDIIAKTVGQEPRGFIAPGWSASAKLHRILVDNGYDYDTSSFPSFLMYPSLIKMLINHLGDKRFFSILNRKDLHFPWSVKRNAHIYEWNNQSMVMLPIPTNRFRISCWHTTAFLFGWDIHQKLLRSCLRDTDYFYYLIHPADLMEPGDVDPTRSLNLERMKYSLEYKIELLEMAIEEIVNSGKELVTMQELAKQVRQVHQTAV